jgi:ribose-phosphate pyrophosphokinase
MYTQSVLSKPAYDQVANLVLEEIIATNTIPLQQESDKIKVLDIAPCILPFIERTFINNY